MSDHATSTERSQELLAPSQQTSSSLVQGAIANAHHDAPLVSPPPRHDVTRQSDVDSRPPQPSPTDTCLLAEEFGDEDFIQHVARAAEKFIRGLPLDAEQSELITAYYWNIDARIEHQIASLEKMSRRRDTPNLSKKKKKSILDLEARFRRHGVLFLFLDASLQVNEALEVAKHMRFQSPQSVQALCETLDRQKNALDSILKDLSQHAKDAHESDRALMNEAIDRCIQLRSNVRFCGTRMRQWQGHVAAS